MINEVILVNPQDYPIGQLEKLAAHEQGLLHRAFSVFIFNSKGQLLLQKRHEDKYHCGSLWTNTCCSHPRPGETTQMAAERRLKEELGFSVPLTHKGHFIYRAEFDNGLTEHELDHVFVGKTDLINPPYNKAEIGELKWIDVSTLKYELEQSHTRYTPWLRPALALAM
jgi:isopentenyl-diphosphate delta-isomerase